jgi:hypothetical protein
MALSTGMSTAAKTFAAFTDRTKKEGAVLDYQE